ncbi:MAG TPA: zinc-binding dehydrogenase, partial [Acidobacteriota bacterium]|nr:zinc-binding dehydrogenase [Acidobacteriota bacterium]
TRGNIREISPRQVFWKQLHLIGSTMGSPREFAAMVEFVGRQALKPVVDQVLSLEEANRALAAMSQSGQFGKLVLRTT